jgi:hypothetical protein
MINTQLIRFYLYLLGITLLLLAIVDLMPKDYPRYDIKLSVIFLALITAAIFPIAVVGRKNKDGHVFITTAYLSIGLRFLLSLVFVLYYKLTRSTYELSFIFSFFTSYILYTLFEIYWLTAKLRTDLKDKTTPNDVINK